MTRAHGDLEIVVLNDDVQPVLAAFTGPAWRWDVPKDGWMHPGDSAAFSETHQTWLWSEAAGAFVLDVFRDRHDGDTWICRRDPSITLPWSSVMATTSAGTPYLVPEVVLLFKAKAARPKDLTDLCAVLSSLTASQRSWLRAVLEQVHPQHDWLSLI